MEDRELLRRKRRIPKRWTWVAFATTFIAGAVDGIGYLLLAHVFTSHMSGNSVKLAVSIAAGNWSESLRYAAPVVAFVIGVMGGLLAVEAAARRRVSRTFGAVASIELALLVAFLWLSHPPAEWMLALPAAAMGVQNALLRRVGDRGIRTTVVTGMLVHFARAVVVRSRDAMVLYGLIWVSFVAGGVGGALLDYRYGPIALLLPIVGLSGLICLDFARPVTLPVSG